MSKIFLISDIHGSFNLSNEVHNIAQGFGDVDIVLNGGDTVAHTSEDSTAGFRKNQFYTVLGNHDQWTRLPNDDIDTVHPPSTAAQRRRFINDACQPAGKTWWAKDLGDLVIIGFNCVLVDRTQGAEVAEQNAWYRRELIKCAEAGKPVILFSHIFWGENVKPVGWYFNNLAKVPPYEPPYPSYEAYHYTSTRSQFEILKEVQKSHGLKVICSLHGHEHADMMTLNHGFLSLSIGSTLIDAYNNAARNSCNLGAQVADLFEYDKETEVLKCWRIGANQCMNGDTRFYFEYDTKRHEFIKMF